MKKRENTTGKSFKKSAILSIVVTIIAVLAINIISSIWFFRIDLTQDHRHSLSQSTIELLKNLEDDIYIKVYMTGKSVPVTYQPIVHKTQEMLEEFGSYSSKVKFELIDPTEGKTPVEINAIYSELAHKGLYPTPIREQYAAGQSTKYIIPGAMVAYKTRECPATLIEPDVSNRYSIEDYSYMRIEYNLMLAIKSLVTQKKSDIAFIDGHGELNYLNTSWMDLQLGYGMQNFYNVTRDSINGRINALRKISIADSSLKTIKDNGNKYDLLIIAQPTKMFNNRDKFVIDQHIMRGGKVLWLYDATDASIDSLANKSAFLAMPARTKLEHVFFRYGVRFNTNLIQDIGSCQAIPIINSQTNKVQTMIFPYALNITHFENHPITQKIASMRSCFAGTIDFVGKDDGLTKTVLATTSDSCKLIPTPAIVTEAVGFAKPNPEEFNAQHKAVAVLVEGKFKSAYAGFLPMELDTVKEFNVLYESPETKQIFISDGDIIRNYFDTLVGPYPTGFDHQLKKFYGNTEFLINCVDYLCGNEDLIELRSKIFQIGTLDTRQTMQGEVKMKYQLLNIGLPILLLVVAGSIILFIRTRKYKHYSLKTAR